MNRRTIVAGVVLLCTLILSSCTFPAVVSTSEQLPVVSQTPAPLQLPPIRFPQDEGTHNDLTEWWYYTGHMNATGPDGKPHHYGFEFVIFQALRSDLPPVYAAHFAISDVTRGEFHFDQRRLTEPNVKPGSNLTQGIDVHVGDWAIQGLNGSDHLTAQMPNYAMHVDLLGLKPATLHNFQSPQTGPEPMWSTATPLAQQDTCQGRKSQEGIIYYGLGGFSYYYSRTRMALSGTLVDHNQSLSVTGEAWMDHQWGNFLTLGGGGGWDWFSIQLNNTTEMMLYFIRDGTGQVISTYAGYIDANSNDHLLPASALHVTVLDHWTSPTTKAVYPSGWRLEINDPQLQATLTLLPELKNQELVVYQSTGNSYWEGAVSIQGQSGGKNVQGEGYVELTGYTHP